MSVPVSLETDDEARTLHPYYGDWTQVHFGLSRRQAERHVTNIYPPDRSGTRTYTFNSFGFRSEEFNPRARSTIFACGASFTVGVGVADDQVWTQPFKTRYAAIAGCDPSDVTVQNFAQGAASNDYTTRTLLSQCERVKPDLVIAHFGADNRRTEWFDGDTHVSIGPWMADFGRKTRIPAVIEGFYAYYTPHLGAANALKNALLLQWYCRTRGVQLLLAWSDYRATLRVAEQHPVCRALAEMLDRDLLFQPREPVDWSRDAGHPGPSSHELFATQLLDMWQLDRLGLHSVFCNTNALEIDDTDGSLRLAGARVRLSPDMLSVIRANDGQRPLAALLEQCFGVDQLPEQSLADILESLKRLIRLGAIHLRSSLA